MFDSESGKGCALKYWPYEPAANNDELMSKEVCSSNFVKSRHPPRPVPGKTIFAEETNDKLCNTGTSVLPGTDEAVAWLI